MIESKPVIVGGVEFRLRVLENWRLPTGIDHTVVPMAVTMTNRKRSPIRVPLLDTFSTFLRSPSGFEFRTLSTRDSVPNLALFTELIDPGQTCSVDLSGNVQGESNGMYRVIGLDGAGGTWYISNLVPGAYSVKLQIDARAKLGDMSEFDWTGKVQTVPVQIQLL